MRAGGWRGADAEQLIGYTVAAIKKSSRGPLIWWFFTIFYAYMSIITTSAQTIANVVFNVLYFDLKLLIEMKGKK